MFKKIKLRLTGPEMAQLVGGAIAVTGVGLLWGAAVALLVGGLAAVGIGTLLEAKGVR